MQPASEIIISKINYSTPNNADQEIREYCPIAIKQKIAVKRKLRQIWQNTRYPRGRTKLNSASEERKTVLNTTAGSNSTNKDC